MHNRSPRDAKLVEIHPLRTTLWSLEEGDGECSRLPEHTDEILNAYVASVILRGTYLIV